MTSVVLWLKVAWPVGDSLEVVVPSCPILKVVVFSGWCFSSVVVWFEAGLARIRFLAKGMVVINFDIKIMGMTLAKAPMMTKMSEFLMSEAWSIEGSCESLRVGMAMNTMGMKMQVMPEIPAKPKPGMMKISARSRQTPAKSMMRCQVFESSSVYGPRMRSATQVAAMVVPRPMPAVFTSRNIPAKMNMVRNERTAFEQRMVARFSDHVAFTWMIFCAFRNSLSCASLSIVFLEMPIFRARSLSMVRSVEPSWICLTSVYCP